MSEGKAEESFWDSVRKTAEPVRSLPSWARAGINLTERNYVTYRGTGQESADSVASRDAEREGK